MSEFQDMACRISDGINDRISDTEKGISAQELMNIVGDATEKFPPINCYPGIKGAPCEKLAFFISLNAKKYVGSRRKKGHLSFSQALVEMIRHMQGRCPDKTRYAILITDTWQPDIFDGWRANMKQIIQNATIEIYLMKSNGVVRIDI
jgi:hypothetical protein